MARDHIDRKTLKHDAFRDSMFHLIHRLYTYRMWIIAGVSFVVLVAVAGGGYYYWQRYQSRTEAQAFYHAEQRYTDDQLARTERLQQSERAFRQFLDDYPDATLAPSAWMYLAQIHWEQNEPDAARKAFEAVLKHPEATPALRDVARIGLATVAEAGGDLEQAATYIREVSDKPYEALKAYNLGRLAARQDQLEEARQQFEKVARAQPSSALNEWARQALDYLP